ncbi:VOC family protein [Amnibacterium sp. CER49]|uniref:VOC family protein n=1 Tax=Amnibacterium sp. CER49 TaxID=3039161 RepID=UPI00244CAF72|nr:VOC family protein [Amnibacterium sp. CER49]MDH2443505.1 VOC family protein [Amnibacterium sp. CER49]
MAGIQRFDHVGITVGDLDAVTAFFVDLGFEVDGRMPLEGEFLDTVVGIPGARTELAVLRLPGGGTALELTRFLEPGPTPAPPPAGHDLQGIRNVSFEVEGLDTLVDRLTANGFSLLGGIGEWAGVWRMASVRGPEGILVNLAERIG